jgi:DUF1680 family protein
MVILTESMNIKEKFEYLYFGEVRPEGWIRQQMDRDLHGFTGHLDELVPDLIVDDRIYGSDRLTPRDKTKDLGNIRDDAEWEEQYLWWNSECQSNWRDGQIRQAILTGSPGQLDRVKKYLVEMLSTQDGDGYLGIYDRNLRYRHKSENGELWAKATLMRGMLALAESEASDSTTVMQSVERAVGEVMKHYPIDRSNPFGVKKSFAGICHGLAFTDILDRLHQLTGKREYLDYAAFLYRNYSANQLMEDDIRLDNILDPKYRLRGHGVHSYEHLRSLTVAWYATGDPRLKRALNSYLKRIDTVIQPSGGPIGDEWIEGRKADATHTGYEYCSIQELLDSWSLLLQKTGNPLFSERMERLFLNAAQGARYPSESAVAYLKSDNSYAMTGPLNDTVSEKVQTRYKYSPVHQDVAVCCVPNAGRVAPTWVRAMWMRDAQGLVANLYGPCRVDTRLGGQPVRIIENTDYPYDYRINIAVDPEKPARFTLKFRKPVWSKGYRINLPCRLSRGYLVVNRKWQAGDQVVIDWEPETAVNLDVNREYYFTYGPLVLASPLAGRAKTLRKWPLEGFRDISVKPVKKVVYGYRPGTGGEVRSTRPLTVGITLVDTSTGLPVKRELVPMGGTVLRQVTFEKR